jgi:hypothetical protein
MAIRLRTATGPEPMPELKAMLAGKDFTIDGDAVMCPHCLQYPKLTKVKNGPNACGLCGLTFHVLKRSRWSFITSKKEIPSDDVL